jgi:hypothetical protein
MDRNSDAPKIIQQTDADNETQFRRIASYSHRA